MLIQGNYKPVLYRFIGRNATGPGFFHALTLVDSPVEASQFYNNTLQSRALRGIMKKRYIYSLLFGIPGLFVAGMISILVFGLLSGVLWIYVFGDNPWPASAETVISILFVLMFLVLWAGFIFTGYLIGRRLESNPVSTGSHILISAGLTLAFLLLMVIYQFGMGNFGPQPDSVRCSDFCMKHGYSGSAMPPENSGERICSCYDDAGNETLRIPLDHLDTGGP